ncbi:DNA topoisomerase, partial [Alistipes shahii]
TETAVVVGYECSEKKMNPQRLFSLPTLQGHITTKYEGWSSDKVLKIAQKLYENKLITYPRTDSVYLDETLKENMSMVLNIHKIESQYAEMLQFKDTKRIFNSEKVESHSAITIT